MSRHGLIPQIPQSLSGSSGFTLLELILSLTILGVVLLIVFGALRIGTRAWEKGEKDIEIQQRRRAVLELIQKQIASACLYEIEADNSTFFLKSSETEIQFVSRNPIAPGSRSGIVYVNYSVREGKQNEKMSLMLYERDMIFMKEEAFGSDAVKNALELVSGFQDIQFEYLKEAEDGGQTSWQSTWNSAEDNKDIPLAVKMTFEGKDDTLRLIVPIRCRNE